MREDVLDGSEGEHDQPECGVGGCATDLWVARSRDARLSTGQPPDLFPAIAGLQAAQGGDAGSAPYAPAHTRQLETLADHSLASGFDRAGPDEVPRVAKRLVGHPAGVVLKVAQGSVEVLGLVDGNVELASSFARSERCSRAW